MDTGQAAEAAINEGRAAVVERVAAAMMRGRPAAKEEEREIFPHKSGRGEKKAEKSSPARAGEEQ